MPDKTSCFYTGHDCPVGFTGHCNLKRNHDLLLPLLNVSIHCHNPKWMCTMGVEPMTSNFMSDALTTNTTCKQQALMHKRPPVTFTCHMRATKFNVAWWLLTTLGRCACLRPACQLMSPEDAFQKASTVCMWCQW